MPQFSPALYPAAADLVLVVIDIQERMAAAIPEKILAQVLRNTNILLAAAGEFSIPVIVTEQYRKGLGGTLPELKLERNYSLVEKVTFSCCTEPSFMHALKDAGRRSVLLCGMESHICVLLTAQDLMAGGMQVTVAGDAVCSRSKSNYKMGLDALRQAGVGVIPTETVVFSLLGASGSDRFKRLSQLIK